MSEAEMIFIVGNSRSGTTMLGRMLGKNSKVFSFPELHLFGPCIPHGKELEIIEKDKTKPKSTSARGKAKSAPKVKPKAKAKAAPKEKTEAKPKSAPKPKAIKLKPVKTKF